MEEFVPYIAVVTVDDVEYIGKVSLSADEFTQYWRREHQVVLDVLELIRKNPSCQDLEFDESHVALHLQNGSRKGRHH